MRLQGIVSDKKQFHRRSLSAMQTLGANFTANKWTQFHSSEVWRILDLGAAVARSGWAVGLPRGVIAQKQR